MNHLLNLVKLASSFPKEINLGFPNSCVLSSHLSFPRARNLELLCPLFMLAFPQARLFFPRTNFGSFDGLLKKVRFYGQLTQKNTYSTKSQSTAKPNNQCWTVGAIFTFGSSRMFGHEKLRPSAVDRSRSRRINNCKTCVIKVLISNQSNEIDEFYEFYEIEHKVMNSCLHLV